jgi:hypothetical protein
LSQPVTLDIVTLLMIALVLVVIEVTQERLIVATRQR